MIANVIAWFKRLHWYSKLLVLTIPLYAFAAILGAVEKRNQCDEACIYTYYTWGGAAKVYAVVPHSNPDYCFHILQVLEREDGKKGSYFLSVGQPSALNESIDAETALDALQDAFTLGMQSDRYWVKRSRLYELVGTDLVDLKSENKLDEYCACNNPGAGVNAVDK